MSRIIVDQKVVDAFDAVSTNTYFVSYPRTGCHWFRALMELYFNRPNLVLTYQTAGTNWLACFSHDLEFGLRRDHVIYLVRDPVDVVFSKLCYDLSVVTKDVPQSNLRGIACWNVKVHFDRITEQGVLAAANHYAVHLLKWTVYDDFTRRKTVVSYDAAKVNPAVEFEKICRHYDQPFDAARFAQVLGQATKGFIQRHTLHDPKVVNPTPAYQEEQRKFIKEFFSVAIWRVFQQTRADEVFIKANFLRV